MLNRYEARMLLSENFLKQRGITRGGNLGGACNGERAVGNAVVQQ
jgi:hypothetical protein